MRVRLQVDIQYLADLTIIYIYISSLHRLVDRKECVQEYQEQCSPSTETRCSTKQKEECREGYREECRLHWQDRCTPHQKKVCRTEHHEVCKPVYHKPTYATAAHTGKECRQVPEEKCELVAEEVCAKVSASKSSIRRFVITEKAPTRAFSWLKAATTAFTFKTLLRHYAKQTLTPRSLNVKLGPRWNYHANHPGRP